MSSERVESWLLCRIAGRCCALPLAHVVETMRPLRIDPLPGSPSFVRGVSLIRGLPQPVIDGARLLGGEQPPRRMISLAVGARRVALLVDDVVRVHHLPAREISASSALFQTELVTSLGVLDEELLVMLDAVRAVPESVFAEIAARERPS